MALSVLADGGYICGAIYNEDYMVEHMITNIKSDLHKIRQSKYVQSDIHLCFREIKVLLLQGEKILFCGAPCQCAGIKKYLLQEKIPLDSFLLVDFICRGANSPKVYRMFLDELEKKYGSKIEKVWFKNKTHGWNCFSTKIDFCNGKSYLENRFHDVYIRGYIEENLYMRPCCGDCLFKGFPRIGDVTLGDFWGVVLEDITKNSDLGTSVIMINSLKGQKLLENIKDNIFMEKKKIEEVLDENVCVLNSIKHHPNRKKFMGNLEKVNIIDHISQYLK
jgi:coenzyme F420-reducing hydrogenase beta subunit